MSQEKELFPILTDDAGVSYAPQKMQEGDDPASKDGLIGFSFKDSNGDVVLPQLKSDGSIAMTQTAGGTPKSVRGKIVAPAKDTRTLVCKITLTASTNYRDLYARAVGSRLADFELVLVEDVGVTDTETPIADMLVGAGQYSDDFDPCNYKLEVGALTGVIELQLYATNLDKASDVKGFISAIEE